MRRMKAMLGILVAITVLINGFMVLADGGPNCSNGIHGNTKFSGSELQHRQKTGEHEVVLENGMQGVCYIYTEYYVVKRYCQDCSSFFYENMTVRNVHSLSHR